ncbi:MAG: hypothetical protein EZS28_032779 [Streblomastix strix]|uniref:Uncharacterized protein n=1 Tax=Streblomastix strix TaxID=222440 RepID=A0A5J4UPM9_9EUKA|nr:MAG: hypothetical protein EZS28_032779 [Streblomastix strix]
MALLENELEDSKFFESILNQPTNIKHVTIEIGLKRPYNCKSKMNEKAKALMEQMMNKDNEKCDAQNLGIISGIINEVIDVPPQNETINEPIIEQTIKEKREKISSDQCHADDDQETRHAKQQEAQRLKKIQKHADEYEAKQKKNNNLIRNIMKLFMNKLLKKIKRKLQLKQHA